MLVTPKVDQEVVAYYASEHGKTLGKVTRYVNDQGRYMDKGGFFFAETRNSWVSVYPVDVLYAAYEITEEQARQWITEMGGDPDVVLSDEAVHEAQKDLEPDPYY